MKTQTLRWKNILILFLESFFRLFTYFRKFFDPEGDFSVKLLNYEFLTEADFIMVANLLFWIDYRQSAQRTVSAHCELALCAEFIVQWLARWAGYSETRVRFPVNTPPTFPHLYVVASVWWLPLRGTPLSWLLPKLRGGISKPPTPTQYGLSSA